MSSKVKNDEVIVILDFLQCIGNLYHTLHHCYGCACRETYRHPRWRDIELNSLSFKSSSDWRRSKLFDAPQSTSARSDVSFATSSFNVMREPSLKGAVTHNDSLLGATFVKRPANSLDVVGSVGCSAPTDPDHF